MDTSLAAVLQLPEFGAQTRKVPEADARAVRIGWVRIIRDLEVKSVSAIRPKEFVLLDGVDHSYLVKWSQELQLSGAAAVGVVAEEGQSELAERLAEQLDDIPVVAFAAPFDAEQAAQSANLLVLNHGARAFKLRAELDTIYLEIVKAKKSVQDLIREVARTINKSVYLESLSHQLIAYQLRSGDTLDTVSHWSEKSWRHTSEDPASGIAKWMWAPIEVDGRSVGRLVVPSGDHDELIDAISLDRGTSALSLLLIEPEHMAASKGSAEDSLLSQLISGEAGSENEVRSLLSSLNINLHLRDLVPVVFDLRTSNREARGIKAKRRSVARMFHKFCESRKLSVLVGSDSSGRLGALIDSQLSIAQIRDVVEAFVEYHTRAEPTGLIVALGRRARRFSDLRQQWTQTVGVAECAAWCDCDKSVHTIDDVRLLSLLVSFKGDPRLSGYVYRSMEPLLRSPESDNLLHTFEVYVESFGNKTRAAQTLGIGRPTLYKRMKKLEESFGGSLEDLNIVLEGYLALRALRVLEGGEINDDAVIGNWQYGSRSNKA